MTSTTLVTGTLVAAALLGSASPAPAQPAPVPADDAAPVLSWQTGTPLPVGRDHHGVFMVQARGGSFLYVSGGTDYQQVFDDVWRIRIGPDGATGAWEPGPALPRGRAGHSVAVADSVVVLTGGQFLQNLTRIAEVYTARIRPDGTLGEWVAAPPLPRPAFHHPSVHHDGWIYVIGGQGERMAEANVVGARLTPDGRIERWEELTPLPRPRSHHASFVHQGALYVVGGVDGHPGNSALYVDVWRAEIAADGTLGQWRRVSMLPNAYATHSAFVHDGYVYSVGGVENEQRFVDTILRAPIDATGRIGAWEAVQPGLPAARAHVHNTPVIDGRLYSVGGSNMRRLSDALHIGEFQK